MLVKHTLLYTGITIALIWSAAGCSKESATSPEELPAGAAAIHLDQSSQLIRGFGGVNMPGWIPDLTPDQILTAFGTGEGQIGLSILRIRVPHDPSAFALEVPAARLAHTLGAILIASPWTPPAWMKTNRNIVGGSLSDTSYASYAAHLQAFAGYMAANGAPLYAVSVQNEPDVTVSYESCDWTAAQLVRFLRQNVAAIGTRIIVPESYNFNPATADAILNDGTAAAAVDIIGGHIYGGGVRSYPLAASKGKELWMTEHLETDTDWIGALFTATEIHDCMKAGMNAYIWWYIRRFYGPIDDDGRVTKRGWVMAQYARFVRPGCVRVNATAHPQKEIYVTAYKGGSRVIVVAINFGAAATDQTFIVKGESVLTFKRYTTSASKDCLAEGKIRTADSQLTVTLDPESVTTFAAE